MVRRITVVFPSRPKEKAVICAREQNISFAEVVWQAVEKQLAVGIARKPKKKISDAYLNNLVVFEDDGLPDLSVRIDALLYRKPHPA